MPVCRFLDCVHLGSLSLVLCIVAFGSIHLVVGGAHDDMAKTSAILGCSHDSQGGQARLRTYMPAASTMQDLGTSLRHICKSSHRIRLYSSTCYNVKIPDKSLLPYTYILGIL